MENTSHCQKNCFCSWNATIWPPWQQNGISRCFVDTLSSLFFLVFAAVLFYKSFKYKRFQTKDDLQKWCGWIYKVQVVFLVLALVEPLARYGILFSINKRVTGIGILVCIARVVLMLGSLELLALLQKLRCNVGGLETVLFLTWSTLLLNEVLSVVSWNSKSWWFISSTNQSKVELYFWIVRLCLSLCLVLVGFKRCTKFPQRHHRLNSNSENISTKYGHGDLSTWHDFWKKICLIFPFMWPTKSIVLQIKLFICMGLLIAGRVVNPYVPIFYKNIVNSLVQEKSWTIFWKAVTLYIVMKCLQGSGISGGLIHGLRLFTSIKVEQYTGRTVQMKLFNHLHSLSLQWHLRRKTGEVMESMERGRATIAKLLFTIIFQLLPSICDLVIAIVYFTTAFNGWFGLLITVWIVIYLVATVWIMEWKTKFQRTMNLKDNHAKHVAYDSLLNFETVKCFCTEEHETAKFNDAIIDFQHSEYWTFSTVVLSNMVQMLIVHSGLLAGTLLCGKYVLDGTLQIGDFILFETYMSQLYKPLGDVGHYYRLIQNGFIDMENMLDLFSEVFILWHEVIMPRLVVPFLLLQKRDILDMPDAIALPQKADAIEFDDVCFSYSPDQPVLKNISFSMTAGQTFALVGASGSGKSTIARLILRFFEPDSGSIKLSGCDIKTASQKSLRDSIGFVPQDCVLFNDSIQSNLTYGMEVSNDEVYEAATLANLHDSIVAKPDKYETVVGERGLNVSGGERQKLVIARTLLKDPGIIVFDEPTSAQDNATANKVCQTIHEICKGKTALIVTHRLSMAVDADCILVLQDGEIVERGSHSELMSRDRVYANMWKEQLRETLENVTLMNPNSHSCPTDFVAATVGT